MAETFQETIIDLGSTFTKIGIPDGIPQYIFPTVVGGPKKADGTSQKIFVGDEALSKVGIQELEYPVTRGLISNWDLVQKILSHALYNEIRCDPTETGLMFIEHPATPSNTREKLSEYLFGELELAAISFVNPATSAICALGGRTGVVLCSGGQTTYSMAVKDGKGILSSLVTLDIGRQDILDSFAKSLENAGLGSYQPRNTLNSIIDQHGYIPLDYDNEMKKSDNEVNVQYVLGDGQIQHFHHDIFKHNEIIFKPELYGLERDGIHKMINTTIQKCDASIHNELYSNIVLAGGNTKLPGIVPRLTNELKLLAPEYSSIIRFRKDIPECRSTCLFQGASYLSAQPFWRNHLWITRYDEAESGIGHLIDKTNPLGLN